jgi:hypothetical protein
MGRQQQVVDLQVDVPAEALPSSTKITVENGNGPALVIK